MLMYFHCCLSVTGMVKQVKGGYLLRYKSKSLSQYVYCFTSHVCKQFKSLVLSISSMFVAILKEFLAKA